MTRDTTELVVRKEVLVRCAIERAWRVFTAEIATWWPMRSHSVSEDDCVDVRIEESVGGRILERARDGSEHEWGRVTRWEPPRALSFTWHPGRDASTAGDVDVCFEADDDGTRVTLEHRGFERMGPGAQAACRSYDVGWAYVLGDRFGTAANDG